MNNNFIKKYTAKDLLEWVRDLHILQLVNFHSSNLNNRKLSRDFFVRFEGCISTEEVFLRKKIYALMSALDLEKRFSSRFLIAKKGKAELFNLILEYKDKIEHDPILLNYSKPVIYEIIGYLIHIEAQNPLKYLSHFKKIPYQSGFIYPTHYEELGEIIKKIEDSCINVDNLILELLDEQKREFTEEYLINHHNFPLENEKKYFLLLDLSEIKNSRFYEVKLDKASFENFQELLNYIFISFLKDHIEPNTYGKKWILENEFGEYINKQSSNSKELLNKDNFYNYIKIVSINF